MVVHALGKVDGGRQSEPTDDNDDSDSSALSYLSSASDDSPLSSSRRLLELEDLVESHRSGVSLSAHSRSSNNWNDRNNPYSSVLPSDSSSSTDSSNERKEEEDSESYDYLSPSDAVSSSDDSDTDHSDEKIEAEKSESYDSIPSLNAPTSTDESYEKITTKDDDENVAALLFDHYGNSSGVLETEKIEEDQMNSVSTKNSREETSDAKKRLNRPRDTDARGISDNSDYGSDDIDHSDDIGFSYDSDDSDSDSSSTDVNNRTKPQQDRDNEINDPSQASDSNCYFDDEDATESPSAIIADKPKSDGDDNSARPIATAVSSPGSGFNMDSDLSNHNIEESNTEIMEDSTNDLENDNTNLDITQESDACNSTGSMKSISKNASPVSDKEGSSDDPEAFFKNLAKARKFDKRQISKSAPDTASEDRNSTNRTIEDPEAFFASIKKRRESHKAEDSKQESAPTSEVQNSTNEITEDPEAFFASIQKSRENRKKDNFEHNSAGMSDIENSSDGTSKSRENNTTNTSEQESAPSSHVQKSTNEVTEDPEAFFARIKKSREGHNTETSKQKAATKSDTKRNSFEVEDPEAFFKSIQKSRENSKTNDSKQKSADISHIQNSTDRTIENPDASFASIEKSRESKERKNLTPESDQTSEVTDSNIVKVESVENEDQLGDSYEAFLAGISDNLSPKDEPAAISPQSLEKITSEFVDLYSPDHREEKINSHLQEDIEGTHRSRVSSTQDDSTRSLSLHRQLRKSGLSPTITFKADDTTQKNDESSLGDDSYLEDLLRRREEREDAQREEVMEEALGLFNSIADPKSENLFLEILEEVKGRKQEVFTKRDQLQDNLISKEMDLRLQQKQNSSFPDIRAEEESQSSEVISASASSSSSSAMNASSSSASSESMNASSAMKASPPLALSEAMGASSSSSQSSEAVSASSEGMSSSSDFSREPNEFEEEYDEERAIASRKSLLSSQRDAQMFQQEAKQNKKMMLATCLIYLLAFALILVYILDPLNRRGVDDETRI